MLIRRLTIENVRSFYERQELFLDGPIGIVIGPNGGGKTNLLDVLAIVARRYLFASMYAAHVPTPEQPERYEFRPNDVLNNMVLEKHSNATELPQIVTVEVEVTRQDIDNMRAMLDDADQLAQLATHKYVNTNLQGVREWKLNTLQQGQRLTYRIENGALVSTDDLPSRVYLQYLRHYEIDAHLRGNFGLSKLSTPMLYLPVNRSATGFQSSIQLHSYNDTEQKRVNDAVVSRTNGSLVAQAIGRLALKYRLLLDQDTGTARRDFYQDPELQNLTAALRVLGYEWELATIDAAKNHYDVRLQKQGLTFYVGNASSGERELLTYLFSIYALNVRNALILIDEPELHLHPTWQRRLLKLFVSLGSHTGNQFLFATHSPTFVSPQSIQYVSRVYSEQQKSRIHRLDTAALPDGKHLVNIVNSQNNERLFFADKVILVEGIQDRIFFEALIRARRDDVERRMVVEVISVGGKGLFAAYEKLLQASRIDYAVIADRDYLREVGPPAVKGLFRADANGIKVDVLENGKSRDGVALVRAIDDAIRTGSWDGAESVWTHIKSRVVTLPVDLSDAERVAVTGACEELALKGVYVLTRGALEEYLPAGFRSKDTEKLIKFVMLGDFWAHLPREVTPELDAILEGILGPINH
jgi:putative ATP-dependent endonuclease of the OLD family